MLSRFISATWPSVSGGAGRTAGGSGEFVPDQEGHRQKRAPATAVVHDQFDELPVSPDRRATKLVNARTLVGTDERGGGSLGDVADKDRLQARAAVAEEREHRQPADEAGQGGEEGIAGADHHAGTEDGGAVAGGAHGVLAAPAGADVGRGRVGVAADAGEVQQAGALPRARPRQRGERRRGGQRGR